MELSWLMKTRIFLTILIGVGIVGLVGYQLVEPVEPMGVFMVGSIFSMAGLIVLVMIASAVSYFVCYPYGEKIAVIAGSVGMFVFGIKSSSIAVQMQGMPEAGMRMNFYRTIQFDGLWWLVIVLSGFATVFVLHYIMRCRSVGAAKVFDEVFCPQVIVNPEQTKEKKGQFFNNIISVLISLIVGYFVVFVFARNILIDDIKLGGLSSQPETAQIVFAVILGFGLAGFLSKIYLDASYIFPVFATFLVSYMGIRVFAKENIFGYMSENLPAVAFSNPILSVLPVHIVVFGSIGSIWGYWLGVKYISWKKGQKEG